MEASVPVSNANTQAHGGSGLKTNPRASKRAPTFDDILPPDWLDLLRLRIKQNKNNLVVVTGETGSGKSLAALDMAVKLDPKFTPDEIVFKVSDFLSRVRSLEKGRALIFDEAAVDFDARRSMSKQNINLSNVLKIFRYLNLNVIFTLPNLEMLDVNARRLMSHHIVMAGINRRTKRSFAHIFIVDSHKSISGGIKTYFPVITMEPDGIQFQVDPIEFELPPVEMMRAYQERKDRYVNTLFDAMTREWSAAEDQGLQSVQTGAGIPAEPFPSLQTKKNVPGTAHGDHIPY